MSSIPSLIILVLLVAFLGVSAVNHQRSKKFHTDTIQAIVEEDNRNARLRVVNVYVPLYSSFWYSDVLVDYGVFPLSYSGFFFVEGKGTYKVSKECSLTAFEFAAFFGHDGRHIIRLNGSTMRQLAECG